MFYERREEVKVTLEFNNQQLAEKHREDLKTLLDGSVPDLSLGGKLRVDVDFTLYYFNVVKKLMAACNIMEDKEVIRNAKCEIDKGHSRGLLKDFFDKIRELEKKFEEVGRL